MTQRQYAEQHQTRNSVNHTPSIIADRSSMAMSLGLTERASFEARKAKRVKMVPVHKEQRYLPCRPNHPGSLEILSELGTSDQWGIVQGSKAWKPRGNEPFQVLKGARYSGSGLEIGLMPGSFQGISESISQILNQLSRLRGSLILSSDMARTLISSWELCRTSPESAQVALLQVIADSSAHNDQERTAELLGILGMETSTLWQTSWLNSETIRNTDLDFGTLTELLYNNEYQYNRGKQQIHSWRSGDLIHLAITATTVSHHLISAIEVETILGIRPAGSPQRNIPTLQRSSLSKLSSSESEQIETQLEHLPF